MVWPKSGCSTNSATTTTSSTSATVLAGISGRLPDSPNSQAIRITKAGFRNSDGWMFMPRITSQRRAPLISAPKYGVAATRTRLTTKTMSAELADFPRRQKRGRDQDGGGGDEEQDLPVDEMERVEPDARGDRRARRKAQHDAAEHQRAERRQRQPVDRPPPFAQTASVARARPWCPQGGPPEGSPRLVVTPRWFKGD